MKLHEKAEGENRLFRYGGVSPELLFLIFFSVTGRSLSRSPVLIDVGLHFGVLGCPKRSRREVKLLGTPLQRFAGILLPLWNGLKHFGWPSAANCRVSGTPLQLLCGGVLGRLGAEGRVPAGGSRVQIQQERRPAPLGRSLPANRATLRNKRRVAAQKEQAVGGLTASRWASW